MPKNQVRTSQVCSGGCHLHRQVGSLSPLRFGPIPSGGHSAEIISLFTARVKQKARPRFGHRAFLARPRYPSSAQVPPVAPREQVGRAAKGAAPVLTNEQM